MKSLKLIPVFFLLLILTYFGVQFVEANRESVYVNLGSWQSRPMSLGFVILTSFFFGSLFSAILSATEILRLYVETSRLKRKNHELSAISSKSSQSEEVSSTSLMGENSSSVSKPTGRFS